MTYVSPDTAVRRAIYAARQSFGTFRTYLELSDIRRHLDPSLEAILSDAGLREICNGIGMRGEIVIEADESSFLIRPVESISGVQSARLIRRLEQDGETLRRRVDDLESKILALTAAVEAMGVQA